MQNIQHINGINSKNNAAWSYERVRSYINPNGKAPKAANVTIVVAENPLIDPKLFLPK